MKGKSAGAIVLLVAVALAGACGGRDDDSGPTPVRTVTPATTGEAGAGDSFTTALKKIDAPKDLARGRSLGKADAKVTLAMFEDFTCPHCLEFTAANEGQIIQDYVKTGKILLEFHFLPLSQGSVVPMAAAYCAAEQGGFWPYQQKLFIAQAEANAKTGPALSVAFSADQLAVYATALGMDADKLRACMPAGATLQAIEDDARAADTYGFRGTPSFAINGQPLLNGYPASYADWKKLLDSALAGK
jgi:protein-disulfide isomerase